MKVLHVINSLDRGGAEKLISELLPYLNEEIKVSLLVLTDFNDVFSSKLLESGIVVDFLTSSQNLRTISVFLKLKSYFKDKKFDLIHVHLFPSQYFVPFVTKNKLIFTEHSTHSKRRKIIFKYIERFIYSKYLKFIFVSKEARNVYEEFLGLYGSKKNIVIYNGVKLNNKTTNIIDLRQIYSIDSGNKLVGMISSFKHEKDHSTLIRALSKLNNVHLFLFGDGELKSDIMNLVSELGLKSKVYFMGYKSNVLDYISSLDLVVQSSIKEGFGLSVLESMSVGKPVLVTDIDGLKEVVDNSHYRFEPKNVDQLANKISILLTNETEYYDACVYSLTQAKKFSIEKTVYNYLEIYEELL